jgi:DNA-binding CsgD family transcriptional regulator
MRRPAPRRARQLHKTIALLRGITRPSEMLDVALPAVRSLVGADVASCVPVGPGSAVGRPAFEPADAMRRADLAAYARLRHQQPLIGDYRRHGAPAPVRTTDVISVREFMRTDLYGQFYRPLGITYQLAVGVPENADWTVGYTLSRTGSDFGDDSIELMTLVQAALAGAHHAVATQSLRRQFEAMAQLLRAGAADRPFCLITIDARGRVDLAAGPLLPRVEAMFGRVAEGMLAPVRLAKIVAASRVSFRLRLELDGGEAADLLSCPRPGEGGSLLFELRDAGDLRTRFGLTPGEYRTLANIVRHETNESVAQAEGVSVPTIEKRMSSVIRKMGVETRVGAVREFLRSPGGASGGSPG